MHLIERTRRVARTFALAVVTALVAAGCAQQPAYQVLQPAGRARRHRRVDPPGGRAEVRARRRSDHGRLVGGGLGSLVGGGSGRTAAAIIVGAIGGGLVGNEMQKSQTQLIWEIGIRYDDGGYGTITQPQSPGLRIGDRVRVTDTGLELLPRGR